MILIRTCFVVVGLSISIASVSAPFSERRAFCLDQVRNRFSSQYEMQKAYNQCMENADERIRQHERDAENFNRVLRESARRYWQEEAEKKKREREFEIEKQKKEAEEAPAKLAAARAAAEAAEVLRRKKQDEYEATIENPFKLLDR